jgi:ABC-type amino acid transport substrate-binding protein
VILLLYFVNLYIRAKNGTVMGMVRELHDNIVDIGMSGYSLTEKRATLVDFSSFFVKTKISLLIKRPQDSDMSTTYYTDEFANYAWILLASSAVFIWTTTALILEKSSSQISFFTSVITTLAITSRAYLGKVIFVSIDVLCVKIILTVTGTSSSQCQDSSL